MQHHASFLEPRLRQSLTQVFGEMDQPTYAALRTCFKWVDLPGGDFLFKQGDEGQSMYVLASGRLQVLLHREEQVENLAEITPGETVGEMALITGEARSADIRAMRDSVLARLDKADFENLVHTYPRALMNIAKSVIGRLENRHKAKRRKKIITNICLLPIAGNFDKALFVRQLSESLSAFGSVLVLDSAAVNLALAKPEIAQAGPSKQEDYRRLTAWLDEQEANHRFVLYVPEAGASEWTRRCIRQADEVLLLAGGGASPELNELEINYLQGENRLTVVGKTLVLIHPDDGSLPKNTQAWLEKRELGFHHHLRAGRKSDAARLARFISGNAVGLVLSGGAAKGLAHIGVLRALDEAGISVDVVGGTSIGAVVAALTAMDWSGAAIRANTRRDFQRNPASDFNLLPRVSIFKGKKLKRLLEQYFGAFNIEDLWRTFFCVSCNLTRTNPRVHRRGSLEQAIRASISIPGVFPPAELDDDLHVDGGVFNNMPVDIMNHLGVGFTIAVDLQVYRDQNEAESPEAERKRRRMPNLLFVVMESSMLSGRYLTQEYKKEVDLYFNPPLRGFSLMDWQKFDKIEELGYQHAKAVLANR